MNSICWYLQGTKDKDIVFNQSKKMVVYCYLDADFVGLWGHDNPQDPIFAKSITTFVVTFSNCHLLCVSKLHSDINLFTIRSEYVALSHYVKHSLSLKIIT